MRMIKICEIREFILGCWVVVVILVYCHLFCIYLIFCVYIFVHCTVWQPTLFQICWGFFLINFNLRMSCRLLSLIWRNPRKGKKTIYLIMLCHNSVFSLFFSGSPCCSWEFMEAVAMETTLYIPSVLGLHQYDRWLPQHLPLIGHVSHGKWVVSHTQSSLRSTSVCVHLHTLQIF